MNLSQKDTLEIVKYYNQGNSIKNICKKFKIGYNKTHKILKLHNILRSKRKYKFNEHFFSRNSPDSFYWAGFIAADGCLLDGRNRKTCSDRHRSYSMGK